MPPVNRTVPDDGYVLCTDCDGSGLCMVCGGKGNLGGKQCNLCFGGKKCRLCGGSGQLRREDDGGTAALVARSSPECRLYIHNTPHTCGERAFPAKARIDRTERRMIATYEGPCPKCAKPRKFEFLLDAETPPPAPAYGGAKPSTLIDAGQFMKAADDAAKQVPESPAGLTPEQLLLGREQMAEAAAAVEEVLKFIPPGQDKVPASAFFTGAGQDVYAREVGRFTRTRLESVLETYRTAVRAFDRAKAGGAHYVRGTQLAKDLLEGMDAPVDPARIAQNEEHERRNAELLEVYYVRSGQQPPTARTAAEMEIAMRLVPCERCASREVAKPAVRGSGTAWTLDAVCAKCGDERTMAFTTKGDPRSVAHAADELGPGPSLWIRKETFDAELARLLPQVDRDPSAAHQALLCVNELIKLVRPGKELDKLLVHRAALLARKG